MLEITAKTNKIYKQFSSLATKKGRNEHGLYTVEGVKSVEEALLYTNNVTTLMVTRSAAKAHATLVAEAQKRGIAIYCLTEELFAKISDTKTPSGVLCGIKMAQTSKPTLDGGLYIYCDRIADPGNAGTIIRTADAVGASGVLFSPDCVDIYNPKVIRSTMGSFFHLPTYTDVDSKIFLQAKEKGYTCIAGALSATATDARLLVMPKNTILVIGNESNGISETVLNLCGTHAILPIVGKAESLNAAAAAAVFMYKWLFEQK